MMKILMVCLGNICRSPLAEGIARHLAEERELNWDFDSAGTSGWHDGKPPDARSIKVASENGIDISRQASRKLIESDFRDFDHIIVMDAENLRDAKKIAPSDSRAALRMMLDFIHPGKNAVVPDPYYGGDEGFRKVYALLEQACQSMFDQLTE